MDSQSETNDAMAQNDRLARVKALMKEGEVEFQLETLGIHSDDEHSGCFPESHVRRFISKWEQRTTVRMWKPFEAETIQYVIMSIIPGAGSDSRSSDFPVISIAYPGSMIVGMESLDVSDPIDYEDILVNHVKRVFNTPLMQTAKLVIDVEDGTGLEAGHIRKLMIDQFGTSNVIVLKYNKQDRGSLKGAIAKEEGAQLLRQSLKRDDLNFGENVVTHHPDLDALIRKDYQRQLLSFKKIVADRATLLTLVAHALRAREHFFSNVRPNADL